MKIVADENIPLVNHYFKQCGELILKPGRAITHDDLIDADMLLVRSVTNVDQALLQNTNVRFVGSATTGIDHLDVAWLKKQGIHLSVAHGSNARAVVEYVICVVAALQKKNLLITHPVRAAVIGVGRIGQAVAEQFKLFGFEVILCDPFRTDINVIPLNEISNVDLISLHTPLTKHSVHPTYHLIQRDFLERQKNNCVLLNSGRGAVIAFDQLKKYGQHLKWCLDVWENEPNIDQNILKEAIISTPHIAGYSVQSKYRSIHMIYQAALQQKIIRSTNVMADFPTKTISFAHQRADWRDVVLSVFNPILETTKMKNTLLHDETAFDRLRKHFTDRHEFEFVNLQDVVLNENDRTLLHHLSLIK